MALICAAKSCKSHSFNSGNCNLVFFPFPDDEETCKAWVLRSGRNDLLTRTVDEIRLTEFLCERHFEDHCLYKSGSVTLKPKAKPSVFDHNISQFQAEIEQEKTVGNSVNPDVVVIPCVIMDADANTEVIGFNGESVKEESFDRADIERELQLIEETNYVANDVLSEDSQGIDVQQQVINDLHPSVENNAILDAETLVVGGSHSVESSDWQKTGSLVALANQICRICANENVEMMPIFEEQSIQLQIVDKIQWHLPVVIKEDDKLPLKICTNCVTLINSWHDLVATCVETDAKLRKLFNIDEQYDTVPSVYCDVSAPNSDDSLEPDVAVMQNVINANGLVTSSENQNLVTLEEIALQATDDSMSLDMSKAQLNGQQIGFFGTKESIEKRNVQDLQSNVSVNPLNVNICTNSEFTECSENETQICILKEEKYGEPNRIHLQKSGSSQEEGINEENFNLCLEVSLGENCVSSDNDIKGQERKNNKSGVNIKVEKELQTKPHSEKKHFCDICGFFTGKTKNLRQHYAKKHPSASAQFICEYCDKTFTSESARKKHEQTHIYAQIETSAAGYVCEFCGRAFRCKTTLKNHHIAQHSDDSPFKCDKCDKNYGSLSSLDIHKATHSSETPYLCDLCGKTFKHVSNLRSHKRIHLDESYKNRQICQKCGKGFRSRFHLSEHMNVHEGKRPYSCEVCGKMFHKKIQLRQHGSAHSGTQPYKCPICGVKFNRRGNMTQHVKRHSQERKYTCRVCGETFPTLGAVLNHRKKHSESEVQRSMNLQITGDDPDAAAFKCEVCGKLLAKKESLIVHMRSHTGEKMYSCPECGKKLSNKGSLMYHIRSFHTGERPHVCQFCGDGFLSKEARMVHERIHTGEKPYECLVCGMAFRCSSNLAQHARVHSDNRPHLCLSCGKRFQRKGALDVHMRTHTGERPFPCDVCGRAFTQKNDMLKHKRTHEKPLHCDICGSLFALKKDLTKHKATKHNEENTVIIPASEANESILPEQTVVITTTDDLLTDFPEISVPVIEHAQTVILERY